MDETTKSELSFHYSLVVTT